jgi:hypothetical protein
MSSLRHTLGRDRPETKEGKRFLIGSSLCASNLSTNRNYLVQNYGFHCMCTCCTLSDEESKASDVRLTTMNDLYKRLGTWGRGTIDGREAIRLVKRIWVIGEEEGYTSERGRLAADAMLVAVAHAEYVLRRVTGNVTEHVYSAEAAVDWAGLALRWASYELGSDSDLAEKMRIAMREPKGHKMWGQRLAMSIEKPSAGMSGMI